MNFKKNLVFLLATSAALYVAFLFWPVRQKAPNVETGSSLQSQNPPAPASHEIGSSDSTKNESNGGGASGTTGLPEAPPTERPWSPVTAAKIKILNEIFVSKNDNDPRLDSVFKNLTPEDKQALTDRYQHLQAELRNERGTVVYLIGKNLNSREDFDFLKNVLSEQPCLSLENCKSPGSGSDDPHLSGITGTTLLYPQLMTLNSIGRWLEHVDASTVDRSLPDAAYSAIQAGLSSPVPQISQKAAELMRQFKQKFP